MIGAIGEDGFGDQLYAQMEKHGINTSGIVRYADSSTGTATIMHTPEDNCIVIVAGANGKVTPEHVMQHASRIEQADVLLVQLEIPLPAVQAALEIARRAGVRTVLNPAPAVPLPAAMLRLVDFITPNETEFELLSGAAFGDEAALLQGMQRWEATGPRLLLTRGEKGVVLLVEGELQTIPAPRVTVVDTTGAGDACNAAFCVAIAQGNDVVDAATMAVKAASLSVTRFGAQAGMPTLEELAVK